MTNKLTEINWPAAPSGVVSPLSSTFIAADWERPSTWRITTDGETFTEAPRLHLLSAGFMSSIAGCTLVIEQAHLQPRGRYSVAQVFTPVELDVLHTSAKRHNVTILAFPERMTAAAREEVGFREIDGDKIVRDDKTRSAEAIWRFVRANPQIALFKWRPVDAQREAIHDARTEARLDTNARLNAMRPDYDSPEVERARDLLTEISRAAAPSGVDRPLSSETIEWFGIKVLKSGPRKGQIVFNPTSVMAIYVHVFNEDGTLRMHDGHFVGVRHIWDTLKLHPYHGKAGTARSNLMYHTLRNAEKKHGYYPVQKVRASFRRAVKELIRAFRDAALNEISKPAAPSGVEGPLSAASLLDRVAA